MKVTVRLFARARDLAGADQVQVDLPPGAAVGNLREALATAFPALGPLLTRSALAVDNEYADDAALVAPDSEVALLPPVSGG